MTTENVLFTITKEAAADLSDHQFRYVILDINGKAAKPTAATDVPFGILQNAPESGQEARIAPLGGGGLSKVVLGASLVTPNAIVALEYVSGSDTGKAKAIASTAYPAGILVEGGAEDDLGSVILAAMTVTA